MPDPRVVNLARTLVEYSVAVQPGETVFLTGEVVALPLIRETYKYVVQAGGRCIPYLLDEDMTDTLTRLGTDDQLEWISPLEDWIAKDAKVLINIRATNNTRRSSSINPQRGALRAKARAELAKIRFARSASGDQRWTLTQFPTDRKSVV